jgi:hypothetical protein
MSDAELGRKLHEKIDSGANRRMLYGAMIGAHEDRELEHKTDIETLLKESAGELLSGMVARASRQRRRSKLGAAVLDRKKTKLTVNPIDRSSHTDIRSPLIYPVTEPEGSHMVTYGWQFGFSFEDKDDEQIIKRFNPNGPIRYLSIYRTVQNNGKPDQLVSEKWYDVVPSNGSGFIVHSYDPANDVELEAMRAAQQENPHTFKPESSVKFIDGEMFITGPLRYRGNPFAKRDPMKNVPTSGQAAIEHCYELVQEGLRTLNF